MLHVWAATVLALEDRRARGDEPYAVKTWIQATVASRYMRWTGYIVLAFILYHLAQFTFGVAQPASFKANLPLYVMKGDYHVLGFTAVRAGTEVLDVRSMVIRGFMNPAVSIFYILAVGLLSLHLLHGADSLFQTLGWRNHRWERGLHAAVALFCAAYFLGNLAIPGGVLARDAQIGGAPWPTSIPRSRRARSPTSGAGTRPTSGSSTRPNKRKYEVIVVGAGLAGASASATLAELGYRVSNFVFHDSPRRAHSIAAQGGINAAKNYQNDGDSVHRLFYDTVKGGDYRSREANVHRLAEVSADIIDQCVAQGVPFAREYGGLLANRSFGGAQVSRTFYARGQTGQQLLLGAYSALSRAIGSGGDRSCTRSPRCSTSSWWTATRRGSSCATW